MLYQTLLELMTKPSEMCCIDCRQRTLWSWNKEEDTLAEAGPSRNLNNALSSCPRLSSPHTQTVKPGFNAVSPWEIRIGPRMFIVQTKHWEFFHWLGDDKLVIVCIYCFFFPHSTDFVVLIEEFGQIAQLQGWWLIGKFRKKCFFGVYINHNQCLVSTASQNDPLCLISKFLFFEFQIVSLAICVWLGYSRGIVLCAFYYICKCICYFPPQN